jgi:hypothetical protein
MWKTTVQTKKEKRTKKERNPESLMEKWKTLTKLAVTTRTRMRFPLSHRLDYDDYTLIKPDTSFAIKTGQLDLLRTLK